MSTIQKAFAAALRQKKRRISVPLETLKRWERGASSPTLETFENVCLKNDMPLPFFFDGNVTNLVNFNKSIGDKMGFKVTITFD